MQLAVRFAPADAGLMPAPAKLNALKEELHSEPNRDQKTQLFKNVLIKILDSVPSERRFGRLLADFDVIVEVYRNDLQAFLTEFSHDRRREEFDRKRLHHLQKISSAVTDVWNKVLAIPIGQALLVTQFKPEISAALANVALLVASLVFLSIGFLLFLVHGQVLKELREEIDEEIAALEGRYDKNEVAKKFEAVRRRLRVVRAIPVVLATLLGVGFVVSVTAYSAVPGLGALLH